MLHVGRCYCRLLFLLSLIVPPRGSETTQLRRLAQWRGAARGRSRLQHAGIGDPNARIRPGRLDQSHHPHRFTVQHLAKNDVLVILRAATGLCLRLDGGLWGTPTPTRARPLPRASHGVGANVMKN